jgi:exodeoxyribonuclease X
MAWTPSYRSIAVAAARQRQRFAIVDTETTGLDPEDRVLELAAILAEWTGRELKVLSTFETLVQPGVPVKHEARAAHHITDAELAEAPTMADVLEHGAPHIGDVIAVGHNFDFDARMLEQSGAEAWLPARRLDTYRLSMHAWPDAPRHTNQILRYHLELAVPQALMERPPHRAMPDAAVTMCILERLLQWKPLEELVKLNSVPALLTTCRIGKWAGRPWRDVDAGMLRWILGRDFSEDIKHTARHWLDQPRDRRGNVIAA